MTLVATLTASKSASLIYTGISWSSFKCYQIILSDLAPATAAAGLYVQGSIDSGSNYASLWQGNNLRFETTTWSAFQFAASQNCMVQGATDNANASGVLFLQLGETVSGSTRTTLYGRTVGFSGGGGGLPCAMLTQAYFSSTAPINAIKFLFSPDNITSGTIRIYGIA